MMARVLALTALLGCDSGSKQNEVPVPKAKPAGDAAALAVPDAPPIAVVDRGVAIPANPPAVRTISYNCSHSDMPFGKGSQAWSTVYDLDAATATSDRVDRKGRDEPPPPLPRPGHKPAADPNETKTHNVAKLTPDHLAKIRAALATALAGGPYMPEYPVSEGISCSLTFSDAAGKPFFTIDKANRGLHDAVNDLLSAL